MTITPQRLSKYLLNQDTFMAFTSQPIRLGATNGYFFSFFVSGAGVNGVLSIQYGVDALDINGTQVVPTAWTPSPFKYTIAAGNFTGVTPNSRNANTEALSPSSSFITFTEAIRLSWVPDGEGSVGTISASFYAKSFG